LGLFAVRRTHIELFARWLEHRGAARATIGRRLSTVTGLYRYCVEEPRRFRPIGTRTGLPARSRGSTPANPPDANGGAPEPCPTAATPPAPRLPPVGHTTAPRQPGDPPRERPKPPPANRDRSRDHRTHRRPR
jgi:hypothetical protein